MAERILSVTAYTTLDLVAAEAEGHDFTEETDGVLDVSTPRNDPDHVTLALELDGTTLEHLPPHADRVRLSPEEARRVAAALEEEADAVDAARAE
ncbi:DUF6360 family protein [Halomarina rubra]|uniref:DUF6360 family protein n=1 Tax=Halomarina rubra TaxID=2071873 RepID=A0ABD6ATU1_9EURY|nr:DUF6360 family protein [Halomarina rubra]